MDDDSRSMQFPLRLGANSRVSETHAARERVEQKLRQVLMTHPGERVRRPTLGAGLRRLAFAPASVLTAASAQAMIRQAIDRFLANEIELLDLAAEPDDEVLYVTVTYRLRVQKEEGQAELEIPLGGGGLP